MNILVYDVAASTGGAASVLKDYCREFAQDTQNEYFLLLSTCSVQTAKNLHPVYFPWIKRGWFHRIWFDRIVAPSLIQKYKIDKVVSLQNTLFPGINVPCELLVHNAIPFSEHKFNFFKSPRLWIGQNLIGMLCLKSIRKADLVIVQTEWMKKACVEKTGKKESKIQVVAPKIPSPPAVFKSALHDGKTHFFYPANASVFKNHQIVVDACCLLKEKGIQNYEVKFTLNGNESGTIARLKKKVEKENLPIEFSGWQTPDSMWDHYCNSILLFPSYLETVGLPLLEAMACNAPIVTSDCSYSHYLIYSHSVSYFDPFNATSLMDIMIRYI